MDFSLKPQVEEMHDLCLETIQPAMLLALKQYNQLLHPSNTTHTFLDTNCIIKVIILPTSHYRDAHKK
jgi:hypothetical protein